MKIPTCVPAVAASLLLLGSLSARTWESTAGTKIDAEFQKLSGNEVTLKLNNGTMITLPLNKLSVDDQEYVASLATPKSASSGGGWPQWRGPNQDNISPDSGLMTSWPQGGPEKLWTFEDAGMGYSSFSFAEGKLFTLGTRGEDVVLIALNADTGEEIFAANFSDDDQNGYSTKWGHGPRSTPTYSDGKLYVLGPKGTLSCLSAEDGSRVWSKNLAQDFDGKAGGWGYSESPLVDGDLVVVAPGGSRSPIVALDKNSGAVKWKAEVPDAGKAEYATVVIANIEGTKQYVKFFQQVVAGVDAESGELLWTSPWPQGATAVIPTPIVDGNEIYITSGYGAGSKKFEVVKEGDKFVAKDVWENNDMKNHHGGVVKVGDYIYGFSDGPGLSCQSWETGKLEWNQRGQYTTKGAIHVADGMLYTLNENDGTVLLVEATPDGFKQKGMFTLEPQSPDRSPSGKIWSHPVVINGKLYLRDQQYLSCYNVKD